MAGPGITFTITGDVEGLVKSLDEAEGKLGKFGASTKKVGGIIAAGIAGAAVGAGAAIFKFGSDFEEATATIRQGTGATGEALDALREDFKGVLTRVPTDFGDASTAVADLNTRLGLTGKPLEDLSVQMIQLSDVTGTDVAGNVDRLTRVFGDWGVASEDAEWRLDGLFRASQNSGIGIDQLGTQLVQFGAPMRNLGFDLDESSALLALWNKTGVNTETVMAGLKAGVGKLAKAGEDVPKTFRRVVGEIEKLGPGSEATAKAIELFGQRAGPDLADAIAGGKFSLDEMYEAITEGEETIGRAERDSRTFGETWELLKNKVLVKLEPVITRVFGTVADWLTRITENLDPMIASFTDGFDRVRTVLEENRPLLVGVATVVGTLLVGALYAMAAAGWAAVAPMIVAAAPFLAVAAAVGALAAGLVWLYENFEGVRQVVDPVKDAIVEFGQAAWEWIGERAVPAVKDAAEWVMELGKTVGKWIASTAAPAIADFAKAVWGVGSAIFAFVRDEVIPVIVEIGETLVDAAKWVWNFVDKTVVPALRRAQEWFADLGAKVREIVDRWIVPAIRFVIDVFTAYKNIWDAYIRRVVIPAAKFLADKVVQFMGDIIGIIKTVIGVVNTLSTPFKWVARQIIGYLGDVLRKAGEVLSFFAGFAGKILGYVPAWASAAKRLGTAMIDGIKNGLTAAGGFVSDIGTSLLRALKTVVNTGIIDPINNAIPDSLGTGPFKVTFARNPIPRLAGGGETLRSGPVVVGERGPEQVWLPQGSRVTPSHEMGGSGGVTVNVTSQADPWQIGREVAWAMMTSGA